MPIRFSVRDGLGQTAAMRRSSGRRRSRQLPRERRHPARGFAVALRARRRRDLRIAVDVIRTRAAPPARPSRICAPTASSFAGAGPLEAPALAVARAPSNLGSKGAVFVRNLSQYQVASAASARLRARRAPGTQGRATQGQRRSNDTWKPRRRLKEPRRSNARAVDEARGAR